MKSLIPRLEISRLSKSFAKVKVVDDISFSIAPGQVTCLLGPSGCGKSTTLRMIAGVEDTDGGVVTIDGRTVANDQFNDPPESRSIGLIFQDFALFPHLNVFENVSFGLESKCKNKDRRTNELLERVGLQNFALKYPHQLSGGEQQRVALIRALAPKPKIMLMDEPFSGLDDRLRDGIRDETLSVLKEEGTAVLLVTHDPYEAMCMADEIALMRNGKIVQKGSPYNIYNSPVDIASAAFFSEINVIKGYSKGSLTDTPFGRFLTPGLLDGTQVDIVIRPQHLRIDFDRNGRGPNPTKEEGVPSKAVVESSRFVGRESLIEFKMNSDNSILKASVPAVFLPKPGTILWLTMRRDRCFVFPVKKLS